MVSLFYKETGFKKRERRIYFVALLLRVCFLKNKMKTKKNRLLALALISSFTLMGAVSAAVQYPDGGVWTYGEGSGGGWAFSNYYHGKKYHYSSIVSRWDSDSDKGEAPAGKTSYAWIWTKWGEQVSFYYDYD